MKRIVVCADDYALAPGVSRAIRELIAKGRINATSVMTVLPGLADEAAALSTTPSPAPVQIGLHVTLTGVFMPLVSAPMVTADGRFPDLAALLSPLSRFRISRRAVAMEVEAQLNAFTRAFGRAPDFVDGHQHVQLFPGIRAPFLGTVARLAPNAWVRQCGAVSTRTFIAADNKTRFIGALSLGFARRAKRLGLQTNTAFAGAYNFRTKEKFPALFARFVSELPNGGVVMCHPGFVDDELRARDTLTERREAEYAFFASDDFIGAMANARAVLG